MLRFYPGRCPGLGNGDEIGTGAAGFNELVGYSLIVEAKMPLRLDERRVDDGILDDDVFAQATRPFPIVNPCSVLVYRRGGSLQ